MTKKIKQFRYYGERNSLNYPNTISKIKLQSGTIFDDTVPIIQLGIQALPGTRFRINSNIDWIVMGNTGIYEIDLANSSALITSLQFEPDSLEVVDQCEDAYLIVDILYQEV